MTNKINYLLFLLFAVVLSSCAASKPAVTTTSGNPIEQRFAEGKLAYEKEDWLEAIHILDEIRLQAPTSTVAVDATYLEGMARFNSGTFISAAVDFRAVRRNYPSSPLATR